MNLNACWLRGVVTVRRLWSVQFGQKSDGVSRTANQEFLLLELHDRQESLFAERESFRQTQAARRAALIEVLPDSRREGGEHAAHSGPKTLTSGFTHTALSHVEILPPCGGVRPRCRGGLCVSQPRRRV
jgi:hypothetical protein